MEGTSLRLLHLLRLQLFACCVVAVATGGFPECAVGTSACINEFSPELADGLLLKLRGQFPAKRTAFRPTLDAFCNLKNHALRSEHCGTCRYKLTIVEPASHAGSSFCAGPFLLSPFSPKNLIDLAHPVNGRIMELVRPSTGRPFQQANRTSFGCNPAQWPPEVAGNIALSLYPIYAGCSSSVHFAAAEARGAAMGIDVFGYKHYFYENRPLSLTIKGVSMPTLLATTHPLLEELLALPADAVIKGRVDYGCAATAEERVWQARNLTEYYGDSCPFWFSQGGNPCAAVSEMCTICPMPLYRVGENATRGEPLASCLYSPDILPQRRRMFMHANYELDEVVDVVYVRGTDALCTAAEWERFAGQTVVINPDLIMGRCVRTAVAEAASAAGVRGLVTANHARMHGVLTARMNVSLACTGSPASASNLLAYLEETAVYDDTIKAFRAQIYIGKGRIPMYALTEAKPINHELPMVEKETAEVMDSPSVVASVVAIPLLAIGVVAKMVHTFVSWRRQGGHGATGLPLSVLSTALALGCVVTLSMLTYALKEAASNHAVDQMVANNKENIEYSTELNEENVGQLSSHHMMVATDSVYDVLQMMITDGVQEAHAALSMIPTSGGKLTGWDTFVRTVIPALNAASYRSSAKRELADKHWGMQYFTRDGFYLDTNGLITHPSSQAGDCSLWGDSDARFDAYNMVEQSRVRNVPDWAALATQTVAETGNGYFYDYALVRNTPLWTKDGVCYESSACTAAGFRRRGGYDPARHIHNSELPPPPAGEQPYRSVMDYVDRQRDDALINDGLFLYARYQLQTAWDGFHGDSSDHFKTHLSIPVYRYSTPEVMMVMSKPTANFVRGWVDSVRNADATGALAENATQIFYNEEAVDGGLIVVSTLEHASIVDTVQTQDGSLPPVIGSIVHTVFDSPHVAVSSMAHFMKAQYGSITPKHPSLALAKDGVETFTFEYDQAEHYTHRVSSVLMYFPFEDGSVGDASGEAWDTVFVHVASSADGLTLLDSPASPVFAPGGMFGSALTFDGASAVRIRPYLTVRTPRVWATRDPAAIGAAAAAAPASAFRGLWASTTSHYAVAAAHDGVEGVVRHTDPRTEVSQPFLREPVGYNADFAVSLYVRLENESGVGVLGNPRGQQRLFSQAGRFDGVFAVYADGTLRVSLLGSHGCMTQGMGSGGLPEGEWTFLVATVSFSERQCSVFVDGDLVSTGRMPASFRTSEWVGRNYTIGEGFVGSLDEVRVHNRSLTQEDAEHLQEAYNSRAHAALGTSEGAGIADVSVEPLVWFAAVTSRQVSYPGRKKTNVVLIPRADIRRGVDAASAEIRDVVEQQRVSTRKRMDRKATEVVIFVVVSSLAVALVFLVLNDALTRPFSRVAAEIHEVAHMDLTGAELQSSILLEVMVIRQAMMVLVANLTEYKSYMPLSMLNQLEAGQEPEELAEDEESSAASSTARSVSQSQSGSFGSGKSCRGERCSGDGMLPVFLRAKRMSFVVTNMRGLHRSLQGTVAHAGTILGGHRLYLSRVVATATQHCGLPESFSGDRVFLTFNGALSNPQHAASATAFAATLAAKWNNPPGEMSGIGHLAINAAVTSGCVKAGNAGTDSLRRYTSFGCVVSLAYGLERYASGRERALAVLVDKAVADAAHMRFDFKRYRFVKPIRGSVKAPSPCGAHLTCTVESTLAVKTAEWMYEMASAEKQRKHSAWNKLLDMVYSGCFDEASAAVDKIQGTSEEAYLEDVRLFIAQGSVTADVISL